MTFTSTAFLLGAQYKCKTVEKKPASLLELLLEKELSEMFSSLSGIAALPQRTTHGRSQEVSQTWQSNLIKDMQTKRQLIRMNKCKVKVLHTKLCR